LPASTDIGML
jgi:hypothetical protein